jgi:predicted permease
VRRFYRALIRPILERGRLQQNVHDEAEFHIQARAADLMKAGLGADAALRQARLEFGSIETHKADVRQAVGLQWLSDVHADLRYATRWMRRQPAFALLAIGSLALGIGANTLVFSVVNAVVLKPLPVDRPDELVFIERPNRPSVTFPQYRDIRDRSEAFSGVIGYRIAPMSLEYQAGAERVWGYLVTGNYFDVLGLRPAAGRLFHQDDDRPPAPSPIAVVSHDYWAGRFRRDPSIAGRTVRINGLPYTVVGVAPPGFVGTELFYRPDIYVPMTMQPQIEARTSWLDDRRTGNTWAIGRLRAGVTRGQAQANLDVIAKALAREYPASDDGLRFSLSVPGFVGSALRTPMTAFTIGVLALAALVLLMACVNLAMVLTARGTERQKELAIRLSIGADRARLVRQLLTETLVLAVAGGVAGWALAFAAARALSAWRLPAEVPVQLDVSADLAVLLFAFAVSLVASLLFGISPARQAMRTDASSTLKGGGDSVQLGRRRVSLSDLLVPVQVATCVVLLAGSLLAVRGLQTSMTLPIGLETRGVAMVGFDVGLAGYDEARGRAFNERALEAVRSLPGVESAAYSDTLPLNIDQSNSTIYPEDQPGLRVADALTSSRYLVSPGFFPTLGIRMRAGRDFQSSDTSAAPRVAIVNETFARQILRTDSPLGRRFRFGAHGAWIEVVGLVQDGKYVSLSEDPRPAVFEPASQQYSTNSLLTARSSVTPDRLVHAMRTAVSSLDQGLALYQTQSLDDMLALQRVPHRVAATALGAFGALALLLAVTGLHGVVAQTVARRRREIGIRVAIGATPAHVLRLVLVRTLVLLACGAVGGGALAVVASGVLSSVVYGASLRDPIVVGGVALGLVLAGTVSCWAPIRKALSLNHSQLTTGN